MTEYTQAVKHSTVMPVSHAPYTMKKTSMIRAGTSMSQKRKRGV
jgi:hypothetical protein